MSDRVTDDLPPAARIGRVTIGDVLRKSARRFPHRVAIVDGQVRSTYAELDARVNRLSHALLARGLCSGDRVATICNNSLDVVVAIFAINRAGLVWVPVNTMLGPDDVRFILEHALVRLAVVDADLAAQPDRQACLEGLDTLVVGSSVWANAFVSQPETELNVTIADRDLAMIIYTSGTTSRPKGAMHGHLGVVMAAMSNAIEWRLCREDGIPGHLPLFHCAGHILLLSFLLVGGRMVLARGYDPLRAMHAIERERLTFMVGLPSMYLALLDHPERTRVDLSSLRLCIYSMAPMSQPLLERCVREICSDFVLTSGQTEMYPITTIAQPDRQLLRFGNYWGESSVANETGIMDEEGTLLPPGAIGELVHRGPNVMLGYYRNPEATAAAQAYGWHHTGDLALIDEHGEVLFVDRRKDMIKSGGENVSSIQVEEALLAHPAVANAAVVGLPHPVWGEAVSGFVVLRPEAEATEEDILVFCRDRLGGFQVLKMLRVLEQMPMTATGKLRKADLRHLYRDSFTGG